MSTDLDSMTGVMIYLLIFFAAIPIVFFVLSRTASTSFDPGTGMLSEIRYLAIQLEEASRRILQEATQGFKSAPGQRQTLERIIRLVENAERFQMKMADPSRSVGVAQHEFFLLQDTFQGGLKELQGLQTYPVSGDAVVQLFRTMDSLHFYFDPSVPRPR